jgi:metal-responsive CopG/Arc/MetJ family transcriptional regulator
MKKIEGSTKRVSVIFTEEILEGFEKLIKETGASFSELIRRAALLYLDKHKKLKIGEGSGK